MAPKLAEIVDPATTVLLMQECQKGVIGERSNLPEMAAAARAGMLPNVVRLAEAARRAGVKIVHATAGHPPDMWGANTNARVFRGVLKSPVKLIHGTEAVEVMDEIGVRDGEYVFARQHGLSPLQGTELDSLMRNAGVRTVVPVGVSINVAIINVTFDAVNLGYQVVLPRDAVTGTPLDYVDAVIDNSLSYVATITTTEELTAAWGG